MLCLLSTGLFFLSIYQATRLPVTLLLNRTLFLCYFVFNYAVYNQLVHLSTCPLVTLSKKASDASRTEA